MNWLCKLFGIRPPSRRPSPCRRVVPQLETLEIRNVLSVAAPTPVTPYPAAPTPAAAVSPALTIPGYTPAQIRNAYGVNGINLDGVVGNGAGQTIAIIDAYSDSEVYGDLETFDQQYGLPTPGYETPGFTQLTYTQTTPPDLSWYLETSLDVEWAHAIAPAANILLVEADDTNAALIGTAANWARDQPGVSVVCLSLYSLTGDFSGETAYDGYLTTPAGHNGVTFVAAAGDKGSPGGYPALSPNVLAIGGTSLTLNGNNYGGETVWDDGQGATGGGVSTIEPRPAYQNGVADVVGGGRGIPDVAFLGDPATGVSIYCSADGSNNGGWIVDAGTSLGGPCWSALIAIADQGRALQGLGTLDGPSQTLPLIYQLPAADFHDVTVGNNGTYSAGPGYDLVTGRGSPVANLLVPDLAGLGAGAQYEVSEFPGAGVWRYDSLIGWQQLTPANASLAEVDARGDVVIDIPGYGIWRYENATNWEQLSPADASLLGISGAGIVAAEIPGAGVWRFEDAVSWQQLTPADVYQLSVAGNGVVAVQIAGAGVWRFETTWQQLSTNNAVQVAVDEYGNVVGQFNVDGVWLFEDATGWRQITTTNAAQVAVAGDGIVAAEIPGYGVWRFAYSINWEQLTSGDAGLIAVDAEGDVAATFSDGIWAFQDGYSWFQLTPGLPATLSLGE